MKVPIIADVHFHFERALESIEAGVHKIRLNPGTLKDFGSKLKKVIAACKEPRHSHPRRSVTKEASPSRGQQEPARGGKGRPRSGLQRPDDGHHGRETRRVSPHLRRQ